MSTGRVSSGRRCTRSSATVSVYARPRNESVRRAPKNRYERDEQGPDGGGQADMREHEPPRQVRAVLDLAENHLHEEQPEDPEPEREQARGALSPGGQIAEHEHQAEAEDGDRGRVDVDHRLQ